MDLIEYNLITETETTIEMEAIFTTENLGETKKFDSILEKFNNYRFVEHLDFLRNYHDCQSYSTILFSIIFIINGEERKFFLFTGSIQISDRNNIDYASSTIYEDVEEREKIVDDLLKYNLYDKVFVRGEMDIKFYKMRSLDLFEDYEEEADEGISDDDDDDTIPAIIESPFISDNCSICLSEKPNILNIPCLHLSVCSSCEETGKLLKCSVCRKKIERKIKI